MTPSQPQRRSSDPRLDVIEERVENLFTDLHTLTIEVKPMLNAYNNGVFPACALEKQRIDQIQKTQDDLKKRISGNGKEGLEVRVSRIEKFSSDMEKLNIEVQLDRLVNYVDNSKWISRAFVVVLIGQIVLTIWQHFVK